MGQSESKKKPIPGARDARAGASPLSLVSKRWRYVFSLVGAGLALWGVLRWIHLGVGYVPGQPRRTDVDEAIAAASAYLKRHTGAEGRFVYEYGPDGERKNGRYNILRHGGTLYALDQLLSRRPDPEIRGTLLRAGRYLRTRYVEPVAGRPDLLAVFSRPGEELGRNDERIVKLGGVGLGLVGLSAVHDLDSDAVPLADLQALGRFILFMQRADGGYHSRFRESSGFDTSWDSLFYPGEAMLGLARLHQLDAQPDWLASAARAAAFLVSARTGEVPPADHWMLIACRELLPLWPRLQAPPIEAGALLEHLEEIADVILERQVGFDLLNPKLAGAFSRSGSSATTGTMLEGLLALNGLWRVRGEDGGELGSRVRAAARRGVGYLLQAQVRGGQRHGGFPTGQPPLPFSPDATRIDRAVIRIDNVQHALSALLGYREQFCGDAPTCHVE